MTFIPVTVTPNDSAFVAGLPSVTGGPFRDGVKAGLTSLYGNRPPLVTPNGTTSGYHYGDDMTTGALDTELVALSDATVVYSVSGDGPVGNWIRAQNGIYTWEYYHLRDPSPLRAGDVIAAGSPVGIMGTTGLSTGVHLHLGITEHGTFINPIDFLSNGTVTANTESGQFMSPPIFSAMMGSGYALAVFSGGTVYQLEQATKAAGGTGVWVQDWQGDYHLLIVDGPTFIDDQFKIAFPRGITTTTAVYLVR